MADTEVDQRQQRALRKLTQALLALLGFWFAAFNPDPAQAVIFGCLPIAVWLLAPRDKTSYSGDFLDTKEPEGRMLLASRVRPFLLPFAVPCVTVASSDGRPRVRREDCL